MSRALLLSFVVGAMFACDARPSNHHPDVGVSVETQPRIVGGTESDPSQDGVVLVMQYDAFSKDGGAQSGCTGSLLASRLVLTARHCVAVTDPRAQCTSKGTAIGGSKVYQDHAPTTLYVFAGKDRPDYLSGSVRLSKGQEILATGADTVCNNDIALIVLDRPLAGAKPLPIKLDAMPELGSKVTVVGWGITETEPNPPVRRQRSDVEIVKVGPDTGVGPTEFVTAEGTCDGDSGGPALAASGAVLGALSRGGNGTSATGADNCAGATNIFTSVFGHADLIRTAYAHAGGQPWLEGEPTPPLAATGGPCASNADCQSGSCDLAATTCAAPATVDDGGCSVGTPGRRLDRVGGAAVFAVAVFFARRRKNPFRTRTWRTPEQLP